METVAHHSDFEPEPLLRLDGLARKSFFVLCLVYIGLLSLQMVVFAFGPFSDLLRESGSAQTTLVGMMADDALMDASMQAAQKNADETASRVLRGWGRLGGLLIAIGICVFYLFWSRKLTTRDQILSDATMMIVLVGGVLLASRLVVVKVFDHVAGLGIFDLFVMHLAACCLLPWTKFDTVRPFVLLWLVWSIIFMFPNAAQGSPLDRLVAVIVSPALMGPGLAIASWRMLRKQEQAERHLLGEQVRSIGGELSRARIVHDAMFPNRYDSGHVRFDYDYHPIAEIGGDYVHFNVCRTSGRIYLTILDVAGHGLAAALTVNRLFGELERIRAEDPDASPREVMELLNRYIHLTMSEHSLYATGACIMLDPSSGHITWVNAGHPPALLRKADGRVLDLPGTTILLGAHSHKEFSANPRRTTIEPGDVLIVYTDGAFEARNPEGRRFGLDRLRKTARFSPPPRNWPKFITNAVSQHHGGQAEDDVLVVSLSLDSLLIGELRHQAEASEDGLSQPAASRES